MSTTATTEKKPRHVKSEAEKLEILGKRAFRGSWMKARAEASAHKLKALDTFIAQVETMTGLENVEARFGQGQDKKGLTIRERFQGEAFAHAESANKVWKALDKAATTWKAGKVKAAEAKLTPEQRKERKANLRKAMAGLTAEQIMAALEAAKACKA